MQATATPFLPFSYAKPESLLDDDDDDDAPTIAADPSAAMRAAMEEAANALPPRRCILFSGGLKEDLKFLPRDARCVLLVDLAEFLYNERDFEAPVRLHALLHGNALKRSTFVSFYAPNVPRVNTDVKYVYSINRRDFAICYAPTREEARQLLFEDQEALQNSIVHSRCELVMPVLSVADVKTISSIVGVNS